MAHPRRVLAGATAVVLTTVTGIVALAGPASASVTGWEHKRGFSVTDSASVKVAVATCTAGKVLVGAGGRISVATGEVHIESIRPSGNSLEVVAYEDEDGYSGTWNVSAEAVCVDELDGLEVITATSTPSSSDKSITATCTGNRKVVGTAAEISGGGGQVVINKIAATSNQVIVSGYEDGTGTNNVWLVKAYAFCADEPTGWSIDSSTGPSDSDYKYNSLSCDPDEVVTGGGAYIFPYTGEVSFIQNPVDFSGGYHIWFVGAYEDGNGTNINWEITTYIICVEE
jgi:hypothetical protein